MWWKTQQPLNADQREICRNAMSAIAGARARQLSLIRQVMLADKAIELELRKLDGALNPKEPGDDKL